MRSRSIGLSLLFFVCSFFTFAQSNSPAPLLNRIDRVNGSNSSYAFQYSPIVGDFNNDGNTDFVIIATTPAGLYVLQTTLGRGDGSIISVLQTPVPQAMVFTGESGFLGAAVADFNGDAKQDVVFLTTTTSNGSVSASYLTYFAGNGDGTFSAPASLALPNGELAIQLVSADFNHDGKADVAILCQGGDVLTYLGKGDGTFQNPIISSTGAPQNSWEMQLLVGDLNKDGYPDLFVYSLDSYIAYTTSIMFGNGDGSFTTPVAVSQLPSQQSSQRFALADLNGDGNLDILADLNSGAQVLFLAGNGKGGFANAVTSVTLPVGFVDQTEFSSPSLLDLNGDGKVDIVFSTITNIGQTGQTLWAQGNGDGTFQTPTALTSDSMWGVYAVNLSSTTSGLFAPVVSTAANQAPSVLYLPTKLSQAIEVSQAAVNFGTVNLGTGSSGAQACIGADTEYSYCPPEIQITNRGTTPLDLSSIATKAPFSQLNDCPTSLPVGQSCEVSAEFEPQQTGAAIGALSIGNGSSISSLQVALVGTSATPALSLTPTSLTFPSQKVGTIGSAQTFTLTNLTDVPQIIDLFRIISQYQTYFVENDNCPAVLTSSCTISIQFGPLSVGAISANLEVWYANESLIVGSMSGTAYSAGPAISVSPSSLDFGTPFVGTNATPQTVTLTNTGDASVALTSVVSGTGFTALNACGSSISPGASCAVGVFVNTSAPGTEAASLTITDNAANSPQTVALTATVQSLSVAASLGSSTSATLASGGTATYNLTITPVSGFKGTIALACSNVPAGYSCTPSPANLTSDGKNPLTAAFTVKSTSTAALEQKQNPFRTIPTALTLSILIFLIPKSMRVRGRWLVLVLALAITSAIGCAGGSKSPSTTPVTPSSQSYTLSATFTAATGGSIQLPLHLTVQN